LLVRELLGQRVHGLRHLVLGGGDHLGQPDGLCLGWVLMACHATLLPQDPPFTHATWLLPGGGDERTLMGDVRPGAPIMSPGRNQAPGGIFCNERSERDTSRL